MFSAGDVNSHGMEFYVLQQFINMDEESQENGFHSDGEIGPFSDTMTGEETAEVYEEEVLAEGVVLEDKTAAVDENPIANGTVDAEKMLTRLTI